MLRTEPKVTVSKGFCRTATIVISAVAGRGVRGQARDARSYGDWVVAVRTQPTRSGGFAGERDRSGGREAFSNYRVISPMPMTSAAFAFFLDVCDFPAGGYFSISPHHAPASESGEAEKPNETHHALR